MKFLVVSHVLHKVSNNQIYGYGPYVKEMNLWFKHVESVRVVAPKSDKDPEAIDLAYEHRNLEFIETPAFQITSVFEVIKTIFKLPILCYQIIKAMMWADHIHLRCPGNMGLLGTIAQVFFPHKMKTAKYAGNWDPRSKQPWSYTVQKWILSNTLLTKNMKVLVYGKWTNQSKNIVPFFTATYHEDEKAPLFKSLSGQIRFIYVGTLSTGKRPLLSVQVIYKLLQMGFDLRLDIFGDGSEREKLETYILKNHLEKYVILHGNQSADTVKNFYKEAHFLIFVSKSEGWPKVVAEAMFWGCLPITTNVSCVNYMIGDGTRGSIAEPNVEDIINKVKYFLFNQYEFKQSSVAAMEWSRQFTLEKFEEEIGKLLDDG